MPQRKNEDPCFRMQGSEYFVPDIKGSVSYRCKLKLGARSF
jgi:hypothetical protein